MNYFEFKSLVDLRDMNPTEKTINRILDSVTSQDKVIEGLIDIIHQHQERIKDLSDKLYSIAPELETIETIAEDEEQKQEMINRYMCHNPHWEDDMWKYRPDKIIDEMASDNPETKKTLNALYELYGHGYITSLYKKWKGIDTDKNIINNLKL